MEFTKEVQDKIIFINDVFNEINIKPILENSDFCIDANLNYENYVQFNLCKPGSVQLGILLTESGMSISIDRYYEALDWGNKHLASQPNEIRDWFKSIFTSTIKIDYFGKNYTKFYFLDENRNAIKTLKYVQGFYLKVNGNSTEYPPIYNMIISKNN